MQIGVAPRSQRAIVPDLAVLVVEIEHRFKAPLANVTEWLTGKRDRQR